MSDIPREQQCTMPSCTEPAIDPRPGALCEGHLAGLEKPATGPAETGSETHEPLSVEAGVYPSSMVEWDSWMPWVRIEGRKQPFAKHADTENRYSWSDPDNFTDHETAQKWADMDPEIVGNGFVLQKEYNPYGDNPDPFVLIDFDNARDTETGEMHPLAREYVEQTDSYADVSTSGTGVHIYVKGQLPEGVKSIDEDLPDDGAGKFTDASIEVYDGKRYTAVTGDHVVETPKEIVRDQELIDKLADEYKTAPEASPDAMDIEPEKSREELADVETTSNAQDIYDAIQHTRPSDIILRSAVTEERGDGSKSLNPSWAKSDSGARLAEVGDGWVYRKGMRGLDALQMVALEERIIHDIDDYPAGDDFRDAVEALRERGAPIPVYEPPEYTEQRHAETCTPPGLERHAFESEERWSELQGERYQEWLDRDRPVMIWGDDAGSGKTTNAALAAAGRERSHTVLFDKHEKAREFINDDATPDGYFHLKGGEQPANDCCMDAQLRAGEGETPECMVHGHPSDWPRMNPIYERDKEDDLRKRYEALVGGVGPRKALVILDDDGDLLEDNPWIEQFDGLDNRSRVVGVHEYQTLKTAVGDRDLILDETPRLLSDGNRVTVDGLTRAHLRLEELANIPRPSDEKTENLKTLAKFAADLRDALAADEPAELDDIDKPRFNWETYFEIKDPMSGAGVNQKLKSETLAQVKLAYNESLVTRIQNGKWNGEPFCMDGLLAALAEVGIESPEARKAIAVPSTLDSCPWCRSELGDDNGARFCTDEDCGWHEIENTVTRRETTPARAVAWFDNDQRNASDGLVSKILPAPDEFPDPLDLDATATPSKVAAMYGEEHVDVTGDEPLDLTGKLRVTQVLDGQYHAQTIKDTESIQDRIQSVIDTAGEVHDKPLFGIRSDLIPLFEFPDNGQVLKYHAARGLNRSDCDAVVCIGAPHPNVEDLQRDAELLAMDRDDIRVGGDEYSTRRDAPNPAVYRKLLYENDDGEGLAVPTKDYSGLVGDLFRESREKEIEQFVHRIRPLLVDGVEKDAYLLTNVPTDIPVDEVVGFDELAGDLSAIFPVPDGALRLLGYAQAVIEGNGPDGFRAGALVGHDDDGSLTNKVKGWHRLAGLSGEDVTQRTVRNWINELETIGLLTPEKYEQHSGVSYTADFATSKKALQLLSNNASFEVAAVRRFSEKIRTADGSLEWLNWARKVFGLTGEHCELDPGGSPG